MSDMALSRRREREGGPVAAGDGEGEGTGRSLALVTPHPMLPQGERGFTGAILPLRPFP
jgi:hypothetical protein